MRFFQAGTNFHYSNISPPALFKHTILAARSHDHQCAVDAGSLRRAGVNMVIIDFLRPV